MHPMIHGGDMECGGNEAPQERGQGDTALAARGARSEGFADDECPHQTPDSEHFPWPHAPLHSLAANGTYFVTAAALRKQQLFRGAQRLAILHHGLLKVARDFGWQLEAWAVLSNHYHFVAHSPEAGAGAESLRRMLGQLHERTAKWVNKQDNAPGRQVWYNFWETQLTYAGSYLARLKYVHFNPVKHGLVGSADQYPWCSAAWFERTARPAQVSTVYGLNTDSLRVDDEYNVAREW
jgi:putative transposase